MHVLIQGGKLASFPTHCRTSLPLLSWDPVGSVLSLLPQKLCLTPRICPQIKITLSVLWPKGQGHNCSHRELHTPRLTFPCENEEILEISHEFSLWRWLKNGPPRTTATNDQHLRHTYGVPVYEPWGWATATAKHVTSPNTEHIQQAEWEITGSSPPALRGEHGHLFLN